MTDVRQTLLPEVAHGFKWHGRNSPDNHAQASVRPHPWLTSVGQDGEISCPSTRIGISLPPTESRSHIQHPALLGRELAVDPVITATAMSPHTSHPGVPLFERTPSAWAGRLQYKTQSAISRRQPTPKPATGPERSGPPPPGRNLRFARIAYQPHPAHEPNT